MKKEKKVLDLLEKSIFLDKHDDGSLWLRIGIAHRGVPRHVEVNARQARTLAIALLTEAEKLDDDKRSAEEV